MSSIAYTPAEVKNHLESRKRLNYVAAESADTTKTARGAVQKALGKEKPSRNDIEDAAAVEYGDV